MEVALQRPNLDPNRKKHATRCPLRSSSRSTWPVPSTTRRVPARPTSCSRGNHPTSTASTHRLHPHSHLHPYHCPHLSVHYLLPYPHSSRYNFSPPLLDHQVSRLFRKADVFSKLPKLG